MTAKWPEFRDTTLTKEEYRLQAKLVNDLG
jgi:hypothetical protein